MAKLRCLPHRLRRQPPRLDPRRLALGGITARVDNVNYSRSPANILELPWNTTAAANFFRVIRENQSCIRRRQKVQLTAPKKWNACDPSAIGLSPDFLRRTSMLPFKVTLHATLPRQRMRAQSGRPAPIRSRPCLA